MARRTPRPQPTLFRDLQPLRCPCPACGTTLGTDSTNRRTLATLDGLTRLHLSIRRCHHRACDAFPRPYRPEAEGRRALPRHEFGLDVIAFIGQLR